MVHETTKLAPLTEVEVFSSIEDFLYRDGPYLETEHRLLARKCGLNEGKIVGLWQKAAEQAGQNLVRMQERFGKVAGRFDALRPKIEEAKCKLAKAKLDREKIEAKLAKFREEEAAKRSASFFGHEAQPRADETEEDKREEERAKEEEPEQEEEQADREAEYVEDDTNAANDVRRRLWRLHAALKFIDPTDKNIQIVGSVIWRMSELDRTQGEVVWVKWLNDKEKARAYWDRGFENARWYPIEAIYHAAQSAGWRYPITGSSRAILIVRYWIIAVGICGQP